MDKDMTIHKIKNIKGSKIHKRYPKTRSKQIKIVLRYYFSLLKLQKYESIPLVRPWKKRPSPRILVEVYYSSLYFLTTCQKVSWQYL